MQVITTDTAKFQPKELRIENYRLKFGVNRNGKPTLIFGRLLTAGKNKGVFSQIWGYYYNDELTRNKKAMETFNNLKANIESDKAKKEAAKKAKAELKAEDHFKVGDVVYSSWGYDQTNVDFYQIVAVGKKSVTVREISSYTVEGSSGMMCCNVAPKIDSFIGEPVTKLIKVRGTSKYVCNGRYTLSPYTNGEKGTYCSWYA